MPTAEIEEAGLLPLLLSAVSGAAAFCLASRSIHRVAHGGVFGILVLIGLWLAGMQFEVLGIQWCFIR